MSRLLFLIAAGAALAGAQPQNSLGGPSLGFVFDAPGHALRPIQGIPGASIFGDPVNAASSLSVAAVSLRQNLAIVNDGAWKAIGLTAGTSNTTVLPDSLAAGARVVVSESGQAAAFYDATNNALSVVTGIASSSMAAHPVDLSVLPGAITRMATGDDGSLLLSISLSSGGEALVWMGQDATVRQLKGVQATASILLWNHGASALVVDQAGNQIWKVQDPGGNAAITLLASDADGVSSPVGAALSADGNKLWIANSGTHSVLGIDINSRASVSLNCGFDLAAVVPLADGTSFRLNELNNGPLWILDTSPGSDPRVVFVPAIQPGSEEAAQ